jgi:hypothetical protein
MPLLVLLWLRSLSLAAGEGPPLWWLLREIEAYPERSPWMA